MSSERPILTKRRRLAFTVADKCEIIHEIQNGKQQIDVCRERNLVKSTVSSIWKNRMEILKVYESQNQNVRYKKLRKSSDEKVEYELLNWFQQQKHKDIQFSRPLLQMKATQIGQRIHNNPDFVCSSSWIDRFKKRHGICTEKVYEEISALNNPPLNHWWSSEISTKNTMPDNALDGCPNTGNNTKKSKKHEQSSENFERTSLENKNVSPEDTDQPSTSWSHRTPEKFDFVDVDQIKVEEHDVKFEVPEETEFKEPLSTLIEVASEIHKKDELHKHELFQENESIEDDNDEDRLFLLSLLPSFKKMEQARKILVRLKILDIVHQE